MDNYADYDFYVDNYNGGLSEDLFNELIVKASREIDRNVNCELTEAVIEGLSERDQYRLQYVACRLCDFIRNNSGANSVSIDGVSISKDNSSTNKEKRDIIDSLPHELVRCL